ncbi:MAG TPA: hypothetical protein DEB46_01175 [Myxococcales bacterium]|nr:hypothetical protein [Myxococcales bacterium]
MRSGLLMLFSLLSSLQAGCADPCASIYEHGDRAEVTLGDHTWDRQAVTKGICGPAFVTMADLKGQGQQELIVGNFHKQVGLSIPNGSLDRLWLQEGEWQTEAIFDDREGLKWPNANRVTDLNGDGRQDVIVGTGFLTCQLVPWTGGCGGLHWFEQSDSGWIRHDVIEPGLDRFAHEGLPIDIDDDGDLDLVTVVESFATPFGGENSAEAWWFEASSPGVFKTTPHIIGEGLGSLVHSADVDGDGDVDLISGEYFAKLGASYVWMEQVAAPSEANPAGQWQRHIIDDTSGPSIQFSLIPDLYGDGITRGVGSNHTNTVSVADDAPSEISVYTPGADPKAPWAKEVISEGIVSRPGTGTAAPGIFGYGDGDDDGDLDLLVSGDGDPRIFYFEQTAPGTFTQHVLEDFLGQAGGMLIKDVDGDGRNELLVTGYEDNVLFLYTRR